MCEVVANGEVVYAVFAIFIALIDMYLGFNIFKESFIALKMGEEPQSRQIGEADKAEEQIDPNYN